MPRKRPVGNRAEVDRILHHRRNRTRAGERDSQNEK